MITVTFPELMKDFDGVKTMATMREDDTIIITTIDYNKRTTLEETFNLDEILSEEVLSEEVEISTSLSIDFIHPDWGKIEGKVDTGADQTSLHAENIEITGNYVKFSRDGASYEMPLAGKTEVSSADADNIRPNIEAIIEILETGKQQKVEINLNDRGDMPNELLIGLDILANDPEIRINPSKGKREINETVFKEAIQHFLETRNSH